MKEYENAVFALADAIWRGIEVSEYAEEELAETFGFTVAEVSADLADYLNEFAGEARAYSIGH